jgi:hypothetical protein
LVGMAAMVKSEISRNCGAVGVVGEDVTSTVHLRYSKYRKVKHHGTKNGGGGGKGKNPPLGCLI